MQSDRKKKLTEKHTLLASTLLIYNKLLEYEYMWALDDNLFFAYNM